MDTRVVAFGEITRDVRRDKRCVKRVLEGCDRVREDAAHVAVLQDVCVQLACASRVTGHG